METVCRTCLGLSKKLMNVFEHFQNNKLISDAIMECTSIKVHKNDGLPINICSSCLEKLHATCDFKVLVVESDIKLRSRYDNMVNDKLHQDNKFLSNSLSSVKEENLNCEAVKVNSVQKDKVSEPKLIEAFKIPNTSCSNDYETDREKTTDTNQLLVIPENKTVSDNTCKDKYSNEMKENYIIKQEFSSDLHNRRILTNLHNTSDQENHSNEQIHLTENEGEKHLSSIPTSKDSNLVVLDTDLALIKANKRRKSVFCKECNRSFGYCYFKIHVRNHNGDRPFKCDICNKGFAKEFLLKTHKTTHSDNRPYSCDACGKGFKNVIALRGHMLRHKNDRPFVCEVCGKGFVDGSGLADHKVAHRTVKNYACSTCGKTFLSKGRMTRHSKKHSDDRPHVCSYCDRRFKDKTVLQKHILIHTGEKPFTCKICSKQFRQGSVLTLHMRIHTGETPYPCHLCPCKFKYSHHLQNHMKVHK